nr:uncharacterized protein LOC114095881 isoform X2 [Marmota flaviventris]
MDPLMLGGPESRGVLRKMSDLLELMVKRMDTLARLENSSGLHPEAGDPHAAAHRPGLSPVPCAALRLLQGGRVPPGWGSACHLLLSPGEEPPSIMPRGAHQPAGRAVNPGTLRLQDWGCVCQGLREAAPLSLCPSPGAQTRPPPALPRSTPGGILWKHPPDSASSHPHPDPLPGNYRGS